MIENTLWNLKTTAMSLQAATGFRSAERTAVSCSKIWDRQQNDKGKDVMKYTGDDLKTTQKSSIGYP